MDSTRRLFVTGGIVSSIVLVALGAVSIYVGIDGRSEVRDSIARERIVGSDDMGSIAGKRVDTGAEAKQFADGIRKHTLAATDGRTYSEMGRFLTADGTETDSEAEAAKDAETGRPVPNGARDIWVTSTALSTALNTSYFAEQVSAFSIAMGGAMLLTGTGFGVLTAFALRAPATRTEIVQASPRDRTPVTTA